MDQSLSQWTLVVAANNESVLENTLLRSPDIGLTCQVLIKQGFTSSGSAYNCGLSEAKSELVVFAHQDVYFPQRWKENLNRSLQWLAVQDPEWGVLGVFGVTPGDKPEYTGHCYSTGLQRVVGEPFANPICAQALDELVLIIRRSSGLHFDDKLPGFHLYGTDICLQAFTKGMGCYIVPSFCIHNSNGLRYLPWAYWRSYFYMRRKWWDLLPIVTCCSLLSRSLKPVAAQVISDAKQWMFGSRQVGVRSEDIVSRYKTLISTGEVQDI
ncbi:MAG: glycosyltransferase [Edaphobacter sp.]|nr:glycosyltransferase [Edaphobacter sp.]